MRIRPFCLFVAATGLLLLSCGDDKGIGEGMDGGATDGRVDPGDGCVPEDPSETCGSWQWPEFMNSVIINRFGYYAFGIIIP